MTPRQWRTLVASGRIVKLRYGVYARSIPSGDRLAYLQPVSAHLLNKPDSFAIGPSALAVHDLPNPYFKRWSLLPVQLGGPKSRPRHGVRRASFAPLDSPWGPVTDLVDTAVTIAAELPLPQALMVTDAVARRVAGTTEPIASSWPPKAAAPRCAAA